MKKIILTACAILLSISLLQAQEQQEASPKNDDIQIDLQAGAEPDIYVDGKKFDFPIELLDKSKIESVNVIKGEQALKEYNAKHGVVLITTKKSNDKVIKFDYEEVKAEFEQVPKVIIDGEEADREALSKLSPDDIDRIDILKGEVAMKRYNAANGVVVVTTKKKK